MRRLTFLGSIFISAIVGGMLATGIFAASAEPKTPTAILPALNQQVPGARIGWAFDDIAGPIKMAQSDGKPVVMVVVAKNCGWCMALLSNAVRCPTFNTLAGRAHFVMVAGNGAAPNDAQKMVWSLGISDFPTVSVLNVKGTNISESIRATGYMDESELMTVLAKAGLRSQNADLRLRTSLAIGTFAPRGCLPGEPSKQEKDHPASAHVIAEGWAVLQ
jgi:hypothetical protein